jgi:hypothetical protein
MGPITPDGRWAEILIRTPDGTVTRLTDNDMADSSPSINALNQVAWWQLNSRGCANAGRDVMFFDGQTTHQITDNDFGNQSIDLSDSGDIIWTEFNFCFPMFDWRSKIKLYRNGQVLTLLDDDDLAAQATNINNRGICAWSFTNRITFEQGVHLWDDGDITLLTDWGRRPILNDLGDVALHRWHYDIGVWQAWLYFKGDFIQVSDPAWEALTPTVNNLREAAWKFGESSWRDIAYMRRRDAGDLNCDGIVDAFDIEGFLRAVFGPGDFHDTNPACDPTLADINQDGAVDAFDIEPFIELLFP